MVHECTYIGFVGTDKHDLILYLARILHHLGKKVLIFDGSETGALTACVPCPDGLENSIIEYRGLNFANIRRYHGSLNEELLNLGTEIILADYGYEMNEKDAGSVNHMIYVTDQQKHNIERLLPVATYKCESKYLIVRDTVGYKIGPESIKVELGLYDIPEGRTFSIFHDEVDAKYKLKCQYEIIFSFKKLSMTAKNALKGLIKEVFPDTDNKALALAFRKAEKGV